MKRSAAAGALALGGLGFLPGCDKGATRSDLEREFPPVEPSAKVGEKGNRILDYASMAPSGHNMQPWVVKVVRPREWIIAVDPQRRLPAVDPDNREVLLSLGAFIENLMLAAGHFGYGAETEILTDNPREENIVRLLLFNGSPAEYPLERFTGRMTVKKGYLPHEIKKADVDFLKRETGGFLHYFPRGTKHAECLREGAVENFRIQLTHDDAQKEMVRWLRLNREDAFKYRDGLTVEGMEIDGAAGWWVKNFVNPADFLKESYRRRSLEHTAQLAGEGGGWFVLTSEGRKVKDLIETGRRFERLALALRERKMAVQPMTQTLEESHGQKQIAENHAASMIPQFILRVGYLDPYPEPVTLRRPVDWFLRSA